MIACDAQLLEVLHELALALVGEHAVRDLLARLLERQRLGRGRRFELQDLVAARRAQRLLTSPAFIASIIFRRSADRSSSLSGPIRPALARDGASESRRPASRSLRPPTARARIASAFCVGASSAADVDALPSAGTATRISRSVTAPAS